MRFFIFLVSLMVMTQTVYAASQTVIDDQAEADRLLGEHLFSLHYLAGEGNSDTWNHFGKATVTNENGVFTINAEHENYYPAYRAEHITEGGYVKLRGNITRLGNDYFWVDGEINYYRKNISLLSINAGRNADMRCNKKGIFLFSRKGHSHYWRLQNDAGLCSVEDDPDYVQKKENVSYWNSKLYVDIFLTQPK